MDDDGSVDERRKISDDTEVFPGGLDDNDGFGAALASIGDLNLDGVFDIAVGAPRDDDLGDDRGAVWILFLNADGTVTVVGDGGSNQACLLGIGLCLDLDRERLPRGDSFAGVDRADRARPGRGGTGRGAGDVR